MTMVQILDDNVCSTPWSWSFQMSGFLLFLLYHYLQMTISIFEKGFREIVVIYNWPSFADLLRWFNIFYSMDYKYFYWGDFHRATVIPSYFFSICSKPSSTIVHWQSVLPLKILLTILYSNNDLPNTIVDQNSSATMMILLVIKLQFGLYSSGIFSYTLT